MCCVVIPAYQPGEEMLPYLDGLLEANIGNVVVVDDGSGPEYQEIFDAAKEKKGCLVLQHAQNRGKGAALKTAFAWYAQNNAGKVGVVTADCDGQHSVADVVKVYRALVANPGALVLGSRVFDENTPKRSMAGNRATAMAMRLLYGINLADTQTGLRGISTAHIPDMAKLRGNRYEFELNMLIHAKQHCIPFKLVPIQTIYFNNNAGSHYKTLPDSARLVAQMCRGVVQYGFFSAVSGVVDFTIFALLTKFMLAGMPEVQRLFYAALCARIVSSLVNYACNRTLPYVQNTQVAPTLVKYYALWCCQLAISVAATWAIHALTGLDELLAKLLVDAALGLISYQVQMRWVFHKKAAVQVTTVADTQEELV